MNPINDNITPDHLKKEIDFFIRETERYIDRLKDAQVRRNLVGAIDLIQEMNEHAEVIYDETRAAYLDHRTNTLKK